jgi:MYXO-CTERM domain-containing protein
VRATGSLVALAAVAAPASADGRLPGSTTLRFDPAQPERVALGTTFGLVLTDPSGADARWVCDSAVGYGGEYDPDYAFHPTRDELWATTFQGLRVSRDGGCVFTSVGEPVGDGIWVGDVEIGGDGRVWAATSTGSAPNDVFVSDDGETFVSTGLVEPTTWWESVVTAPSDPQRVWVTGYDPAAGGTVHLRRSADGGETWSAMPLDGIQLGRTPRAVMAGLAPLDPSIVFLLVRGARSALEDTLYRSADDGTSWTRVLELAGPLRGFAISPDGQTVYAGTAVHCPGDDPTAARGCLMKSVDAGLTFAEAATSPRIGPSTTPTTSNGLAFGPDDALYALGSNGLDGFILGRSSDGAASFEPVLRLPDIDGPASCPAGSEQASCAAIAWDLVCLKHFICPAPDSPDADPQDGTVPVDAGTGGCGCRHGGASSIGGLGGLALTALLARRRRSDRVERARWGVSSDLGSRA